MVAILIEKTRTGSNSLFKTIHSLPAFQICNYKIFFILKMFTHIMNNTQVTAECAVVCDGEIHATLENSLMYDPFLFLFCFLILLILRGLNIKYFIKHTNFEILTCYIVFIVK